MATPTVSMQIFGEIGRARTRKRKRSEAAKKAWRTRRRMAKVTLVMRKWLTWLAERPVNVILQRIESYRGSMFSFASYPPMNAPSLYPPDFTRGTFWALQKRGWIEQFVRTEPQYSGCSYGPDGSKESRDTYTIYWRIAEKGRKALASAAKPK